MVVVAAAASAQGRELRREGQGEGCGEAQGNRGASAAVVDGEEVWSLCQGEEARGE